MDVPRPLVDNQLEYCLRTKSSKFQGDFEQRRVQLMAVRSPYPYSSLVS